MVKRKKDSTSKDPALAERNERMSQQATHDIQWRKQNEKLWSAPLHQQLEHWLTTWSKFQQVVSAWDPVLVVSALERMFSASQMALLNLTASGESQATELRTLASELDSVIDGLRGELRILNGAGLLGDWNPESRAQLGTVTSVPPSLMTAGAAAEVDVRRVLARAHHEPRLRVRAGSLLARLAVTVMQNGGVLLKQKAHVLHTGLDRTPSASLEKLMTPRGKWTSAGLGTVDGDCLRASSAGLRQAQRLVDLGVRPLGERA